MVNMTTDGIARIRYGSKARAIEKHTQGGSLRLHTFSRALLFFNVDSSCTHSFALAELVLNAIFKRSFS